MENEILNENSKPRKMGFKLRDLSEKEFHTIIEEKNQFKFSQKGILEFHLSDIDTTSVPTINNPIIESPLTPDAGVPSDLNNSIDATAINSQLEVQEIQISYDEKSFKLAGSIYRFAPDGLKFKKVALLTLPYSCAKDVEAALQIYCHNPENSSWELMKKISQNTDNKTITVEINHLSDYAPGSGSYKVDEAGTMTNLSIEGDVDPQFGTAAFSRTDISVKAAGVSISLSSRFNSDYAYATLIPQVGVGMQTTSGTLTVPDCTQNFYRIANGWTWNLPFLIQQRNVFKLALSEGKIFDFKNVITAMFCNQSSTEASPTYVDGYAFYWGARCITVKQAYSGTSAPSSQSGYSTGDKVIWNAGNGNNGHVYQWNGTSWVDIFTSGFYRTGNVIGINDMLTVLTTANGTSSGDYTWNGSTWVLNNGNSYQSPQYSEYSGIATIIIPEIKTIITCMVSIYVKNGNSYHFASNIVVHQPDGKSLTFYESTNLGVPDPNLAINPITSSVTGSIGYIKTIKDPTGLNHLYYSFAEGGSSFPTSTISGVVVNSTFGQSTGIWTVQLQANQGVLVRAGDMIICNGEIKTIFSINGDVVTISGAFLATPNNVSNDEKYGLGDTYLIPTGQLLQIQHSDGRNLFAYYYAINNIQKIVTLLSSQLTYGTVAIGDSFYGRYTFSGADRGSKLISYEALNCTVVTGNQSTVGQVGVTGFTASGNDMYYNPLQVVLYQYSLTSNMAGNLGITPPVLNWSGDFIQVKNGGSVAFGTLVQTMTSYNSINISSPQMTPVIGQILIIGSDARTISNISGTGNLTITVSNAFSSMYTNGSPYIICSNGASTIYTIAPSCFSSHSYTNNTGVSCVAGITIGNSAPYLSDSTHPGTQIIIPAPGDVNGKINGKSASSVITAGNAYLVINNSPQLITKIDTTTYIGMWILVVDATYQSVIQSGTQFTINFMTGFILTGSNALNGNLIISSGLSGQTGNIYDTVGASFDPSDTITISDSLGVFSPTVYSLTAWSSPNLTTPDFSTPVLDQNWVTLMTGGNGPGSIQYSCPVQQGSNASSIVMDLSDIVNRASSCKLTIYYPDGAAATSTTSFNISIDSSSHNRYVISGFSAFGTANISAPIGDVPPANQGNGNPASGSLYYENDGGWSGPFPPEPATQKYEFNNAANIGTVSTDDGSQGLTTRYFNTNIGFTFKIDYIPTSGIPHENILRGVIAQSDINSTTSFNTGKFNSICSVDTLYGDWGNTNNAISSGSLNGSVLTITLSLPIMQFDRLVYPWRYTYIINKMGLQMYYYLNKPKCMAMATLKNDSATSWKQINYIYSYTFNPGRTTPFNSGDYTTQISGQQINEYDVKPYSTQIVVTSMTSNATTYYTRKTNYYIDNNGLLGSGQSGSQSVSYNSYGSFIGTSYVISEQYINGWYVQNRSDKQNSLVNSNIADFGLTWQSSVTPAQNGILLSSPPLVVHTNYDSYGREIDSWNDVNGGHSYTKYIDKTFNDVTVVNGIWGWSNVGAQEDWGKYYNGSTWVSIDSDNLSAFNNTLALGIVAGKITQLDNQRNRVTLFHYNNNLTVEQALSVEVSSLSSTSELSNSSDFYWYSNCYYRVNRQKFTYNNNGEMIVMTYPSGKSINLTYGNGYKLSYIMSDYRSINDTPDTLPATTQYLVDKFDYDIRGRMTNKQYIFSNAADGSSPVNPVSYPSTWVSYAYDGLSRLITKENVITSTMLLSYVYDDINRVVISTNSLGTRTRKWYDEFYRVYKQQAFKPDSDTDALTLINNSQTATFLPDQTEVLVSWNEKSYDLIYNNDIYTYLYCTPSASSYLGGSGSGAQITLKTYDVLGRPLTSSIKNDYLGDSGYVLLSSAIYGDISNTVVNRTYTSPTDWKENRIQKDWLGRVYRTRTYTCNSPTDIDVTTSMASSPFINGGGVPALDTISIFDLIGNLVQQSLPNPHITTDIWYDLSSFGVGYTKYQYSGIAKMEKTLFYDLASDKTAPRTTLTNYDRDGNVIYSTDKNGNTTIINYDSAQFPISYKTINQYITIQNSHLGPINQTKYEVLGYNITAKQLWSGSSLPSSGIGFNKNDEIIWNSGTGHDNCLYQWDGANWNNVYNPPSGDIALIGITSPSCYIFNGTQWNNNFIIQNNYSYNNSGSMSTYSQSADGLTRSLGNSYDGAGNLVAQTVFRSDGPFKTLVLKPVYHLNTPDSTNANSTAIASGIIAKQSYGGANAPAAWIASTSYDVGDLVVYNGINYTCTIANNNAVWTSGNWTVAQFNIGDQIIWNSGTGSTNHCYQWDGTNWNNVYTPVQGDDAAIGIGGAVVYNNFNGSVWTSGYTPTLFNTANFNGTLASVSYCDNSTGDVIKTVTYTQNSLLYLTSINTSGIADQTYVRDFMGTITSWNSNSYTYDGLNRLTSAGNENYFYDNLGNITTRGSKTFSYLAGEGLNANDDSMRLNTYTDPTAGVVWNYSYDLQGNITSIVDGSTSPNFNNDRFHSLNYDGLNCLRSMFYTDPVLLIKKKDSYWYDINGLRFKKIESKELTSDITNNNSQNLYVSGFAYGSGAQIPTPTYDSTWYDPGNYVTTYTMYSGNDILYQEVYTTATTQGITTTAFTSADYNLYLGEMNLAHFKYA
jgi:hypothetical protein